MTGVQIIFIKETNQTHCIKMNGYRKQWLLKDRISAICGEFSRIWLRWMGARLIKGAFALEIF